jgi:hypothetical protein
MFSLEGWRLVLVLGKGDEDKLRFLLKNYLILLILFLVIKPGSQFPDPDSLILDPKDWLQEICIERTSTRYGY